MVLDILCADVSLSAVLMVCFCVFENIRWTVYLWMLEGGFWVGIMAKHVMVRAGERVCPPSIHQSKFLPEVVQRSATLPKQQVQVSTRYLLM